MVKSIASRVATRYKVAVAMPEPGNWTVKDLQEWYDHVPKPKSVYDHLAEAVRPFGWATPAPVMSGEMPKPWRVAHADRAKDLLKKLFPESKDAYVDYGDGLFRGRLQLWVGLRDNRDPEAHAVRMDDLAEGLQKAGLKIRYQRQGNRVTLYLLDDLPKDVLKAS